MEPKRLLEASAALLGANWAPGASPGCSQNAPGDPRDRKKIHCYLPGGLRRNFQARFHPPRGSRGGLWPPFREPPGVILPLLLATSVETTKISQKSGHVYLFFLICGEHFYVMFGTLLPTLLRARRPREHGKNLKIQLVSTGPKPYAPFSRNARNDLISDARRSENRPKKQCPKKTLRDKTQRTKYHHF